MFGMSFEESGLRQMPRGRSTMTDGMMMSSAGFAGVRLAEWVRAAPSRPTRSQGGPAAIAAASTGHDFDLRLGPAPVHEAQSASRPPGTAPGEDFQRDPSHTIAIVRHYATVGVIGQ